MIKKCILVFVWSTAVILPAFQWYLSVLDGFSKNQSKTKFNENPSSGSRVFFSCGRTDRQDDVNGRFFRNWYIGLRVKYRLFSPHFNDTWAFSTDFLKSTQRPNFTKIRPVGAEFFFPRGRTDFRNFANAPKNKPQDNLYWKFPPQHKNFTRNPFGTESAISTCGSQGCEPT